MPAKKLSHSIKIAEWRRSQTERVRIALEPFRGRNVVALRTWWMDNNGKDRAGIALQPLGRRECQLGDPPK